MRFPALALLLAGLLIAPLASAAAPAPSAPAMFWLRSDGTSGFGPLPAGADTYDSCSGVAPQQNACTLHAQGTLSMIGFDVWQDPQLYSIRVTVSGSNGGSLIFSCSFAIPGFVLPFLSIRCAVISQQGPVPAGDLVAAVHVGLYGDLLPLPPPVPSPNDVELGYGPWGASIFAKN